MIPVALQAQLTDMQRQMQQMTQQLAFYQQREQSNQYQQQHQFQMQYQYPQQYMQQPQYMQQHQYVQQPQYVQPQYVQPQQQYAQPSQTVAEVPVAAEPAAAVNESSDTSSPTPASPPPTPSSTPNPTSSSSPVAFSSILKNASSLPKPIPTRNSSFAQVVGLSGDGPAIPTSAVPSVRPSMDSASISKCIKSFKNFASPPNRLELWCKCDYCKFYAMNGVDVTTSSAIKDMKNLIVDKGIDFMAFPFRMVCKCGAKTNDKCTHPQSAISMLFAHEEDPEYDEAWFSVEWEDRCSRAHCWDKNCKRQHHALTLRDKKIF